MRFHDFFAGIGGSSTGLSTAVLEGIVALNHWDYAIELHNPNHPEMDHDQADIWKADPRRYRSAEVGWFSPECRAWSRASGKSSKARHYKTDLWRNPTTDPADDRSRMLMESVPYVSAIADYKYVLVENVVEVTKWIHFNRWLKEMHNLGYNHKLLYLNSMFFGTPQSRDRFFAVFWQQGMPAPDLDFRPLAECPKCGFTEAIQAWKPNRSSGKYKQQYVYCCPTCAQIVEPFTVGSEAIIDWTLEMPRIGDRPKGLSQLTIAKIKRGIEKYADAFVLDTARSHDTEKSRPLNDPLFTQTTQQSLALTVAYYGRESAVRSTDEPLATVPTENKIGLAYIETLRTTNAPRRLDEPLTTVVASAQQHALVMANYGQPVFRQTDEPMPPVTTVPKHGLIMAYNGNPVFRPIDEPMPTVSTVERHGAIVPEVDIDDVRFRMLKPRELASGTGFPTSYILTGSQKNQVKGIGGAVDPHVACWLGQRILEAVG
ncbi:MAG: DNA cytosine methyltransferase [Anaerolineae bacterium]|nr:DNA cytosine methyltransferase [Anaerolineae bacterium]